MKVNYNLTGKDRKALVKAIEAITGEKAKYQGMPSAAYTVGEFIVTKQGEVECENAENLQKLINCLGAKGYSLPQSDEPLEVSISMPIEKVCISNLSNLLHSKGDLIQKALGAKTIQFEIEDDRITFPWFEDINVEQLNTYTKFLTMVCKQTMEQKRINSEKREIENEKYAFRCYLLKLGFIGDEYKADRKILLKNLEGSAAFKNGKRASA